MNQIPIFCMWQLTGPGDDGNFLCLFYSKHSLEQHSMEKALSSSRLLAGFKGTLGFSASCFKLNSRILSLLFVVACLGLETPSHYFCTLTRLALNSQQSASRIPSCRKLFKQQGGDGALTVRADIIGTISFCVSPTLRVIMFSQ